jgi:hypothetical protein
MEAMEAEAEAAAAAPDKPVTVGDGAYAAPPDTHDDTTQVPDTMEQGLGEGDGDGDQGSWLPTPLAVWQPNVFELDPFEEGEDPEEPDPVFVTAMDEELRTSMMRCAPWDLPPPPSTPPQSASQVLFQLLSQPTRQASRLRRRARRPPGHTIAQGPKALVCLA